MSAENTDVNRTEQGRFGPGNAGKPKGARHTATRAIEKLLEGEAESLSRKAVEMSLEGDTTALRLCLDRICPVPKGRRVQFKLPAVEGATDLPGAFSALLAAVADGELSSDEAKPVADMLDRWRAGYEASELEQRLAALEGSP